jgi:RHS repeat-associated protein
VGAGTAITASLAGETNRWHYWTSVYDNGTLKFYLDGSLVGQRTASGVPGTNAYTFKLGTDNEGTYPAAADIDQLRIYKRSLSSSEIAPLVIPGSSGSSGGSYTYASASNRMTSAPGATISLDAAGNTLANGTLVFTYNNAGQLATASGGGFGGASYAYNAQNLRTQKTIGSSVTVYHYDLQGRLIAESRGDSTPFRAYVWDDSQPIAQIDYAPGNEKLFYLHTDHLATPRLATDSAQRVVWRYEGEAFGASVPNEDPDGDGARVTINLRFPGQYYDAETGLHYNWHRYYDPKIGRYITSDPIGLKGGLNTYAYVSSGPLRWVDFTGLWRYNAPPPQTQPVTPAMGIKISCLENCLGNELVVTGGSELHGGTRDPHSAGAGVDFGFGSNPNLRSQKKKFLCCAQKCGFTFAWEEPNPFTPGASPHFHLEFPTFTNVGNDLPIDCDCRQ